MVRQRFADEIKSDLVEALVPRYFREETGKRNLAPISQPRITDLSAWLPDQWKIRHMARIRSLNTVPPAQ